MDDGSRRRRPTLATVAASAGVSVATVSKVLNGRSDVAPATRAMVEDILRRYEFPPVPRRAEGQQVATVELMFDRDLHAYSAEVAHGAIDVGEELGIGIVVSIQADVAGSYRRHSPTEWARRLATSGRKALITVTGSLTAAHVNALRAHGIPLVVVDPLHVPHARITSVGSTNFSGGLAAGEHLLSLGHTLIGHAGGPTTAACSQARVAGLRSAVEAAGLTLPEGYVRFGEFVYESGFQGGGALLDLPRRPTAIFAGSDEMALGVIEAARVRGLRVPEDLSIVGFDDTQLAQMASPPLTTVRQPLHEMGAVAVRTALRLAAGEAIDSHHVELATRLVVRGSTAPPR
jgi:LacI family transcriptional regulator